MSGVRKSTGDENDGKNTTANLVTDVELLPTSINSLDARILQYMYSIEKLEAYSRSIKRLLEECIKSTKEDAHTAATLDPDSAPTDSDSPPKNQTEDLALVNYIISLSGMLFSISEPGFNPRLSRLSHFTLFKNTPINISTLVTHIPYDAPDNNDGPLLQLPSAATGIKCLRALLALCASCLQGYKKRLDLAKIEKEKCDGTPTNYYGKLSEMIRKEILNLDVDIDLTLKDMTFPVPKDPESLANDSFVEASLVDIDIKMIPLITQNLLKSIGSLKITLLRFKNLKNNNSKSTVPNFSYSLHKIFVLTLRINDIYTMLRKFGRRFYLSNTQHLTDQKFLFQTRNASYFRSHHLGTMEEMFNATKKNGPLIATLTRFIRQTANFEVCVKNILDFISFINQSQLLIESHLQKLEDFGNTWLVSEIRFRKVYQLPHDNLIGIYRFSTDLKTRLFTKVLPESSPDKPKDLSPESMPNVKGESLPPSLRDLESEASASGTRSRSSSTSSVQSNGSGVSLGRKNSLNSPRRNSTLIVKSASQAGPSPNKPRPPSALFLNHNSSVTSLDSGVHRQKAGAASPVGRRRSNSQPTTLDAESSSMYGLRSPSGSIKSSSKKNPPAVSRTHRPSGSLSGDGLNKVQKHLLAVAEEDSEPISKTDASSAAAAAISKKNSTQLTATQRFQQHVREMAKSGSLVTQQKEVLTSITFDPNNPSGYGLRKEASEKSPPKESTTPSAPPKRDPPKSTAGQPSTYLVSPRDIATRHNTQRNSVLNIADTESGDSNLTLDSTSTSSVSSHEPTLTGTVVKKVRFTGVPEYTEEEDKPSTYSSRILNRFAVFSAPRLTNHQQVYRKRDQLSAQEGMEFRNQLHGEHHSEPENAGVPSTTQKNQKSSRGFAGVNGGFGRPASRLSKLKNKMM